MNKFILLSSITLMSANQIFASGVPGQYFDEKEIKETPISSVIVDLDKDNFFSSSKEKQHRSTRSGKGKRSSSSPKGKASSRSSAEVKVVSLEKNKITHIPQRDYEKIVSELMDGLNGYKQIAERNDSQFMKRLEENEGSLLCVMKENEGDLTIAGYLLSEIMKDEVLGAAVSMLDEEYSNSVILTIQ